MDGPTLQGVPQAHAAGGHSIVHGCTLSLTALRMLIESAKKSSITSSENL